MTKRYLVLLGAAAVLVGCSSDPAPTPAADAATDLGAPLDGADAATGMDAAVNDSGIPTDDVAVDVLMAPDVPRTSGEDVLEPQRQACAFGPGAWAAQTVGREVPVGDQMPIDHIIVLMQENRSFDHYFGRLAAMGQPDAEGPPDSYSNPGGADGGVVTFHHDTERCLNDTNHEWDGAHRQYNNGAMDGFVVTNQPHGDRALTYFDGGDIPFYYALANTFAIGDRYFSSLIGPTWPNRLYLMAATSFGRADNAFISQDTAAHPVPQIFSLMDAAGVTWGDYAGGARMLGFLPYYGILRRATIEHEHRIDDLMRDLAAGTLPQVSFVEPDYLGAGGTRVDEHPPGIPMSGERWVEGIVRGLMASPLWARTALFITYDEHGGFADHVPPHPACEPDNLPPQVAGAAVPGRFDRLGFRVPFIVVSPYARRHFVSHRTFDHTSILRFIEARFGLPALTRRDANAALPTDLFDFASPPFMTPPMLPPAGAIDPATVARCNTQYPSETSGL
jgi:phospholipase C